MLDGNFCNITADEIERFRREIVERTGCSTRNPLYLIVEIKGYRCEDAKEKKAIMDTYWIPGVNNSKVWEEWVLYM